MMIIRFAFRSEWRVQRTGCARDTTP